MILSFKVRNSSRNILEAPSGLKFGNDVMFKGLASGQIACIHLNVHYIIKYFFQYFSSVNLKRNIRVMNQLNPICAFLLVVIKHCGDTTTIHLEDANYIKPYSLQINLTRDEMYSFHPTVSILLCLSSFSDYPKIFFCFLHTGDNNHV